MKKLRKLLKTTIKIVLAFIIGGIVFGTIGAYAATTLLSQSVYYNNSTSGATSTNVQGAIDELYTRSNTWINPNNMGTPQYYAFGTYKGWCSSADTSCKSYADFPTTETTPPSGKNVYAAKYADGQYGVCIKRNGTEHCFRGRNWKAEREHVQKVFSDNSCGVSSSSVHCSASDFFCYVFANGHVTCSDYGMSEGCYVNDGGFVNCISF